MGWRRGSSLSPTRLLGKYMNYLSFQHGWFFKISTSRSPHAPTLWDLILLHCPYHGLRRIIWLMLSRHCARRRGHTGWDWRYKTCVKVKNKEEVEEVRLSALGLAVLTEWTVGPVLCGITLPTWRSLKRPQATPWGNQTRQSALQVGKTMNTLR